MQKKDPKQSDMSGLGPIWLCYGKVVNLRDLLNGVQGFGVMV